MSGINRIELLNSKFVFLQNFISHILEMHFTRFLNLTLKFVQMS